MHERIIHFYRGETLLIRWSAFDEIPLLRIFIKPLYFWNFLSDLQCKMLFHKMIINFQNPTVENFYWNIFIKKVFLPWYLPKSGQLSLISCQINYWPRSKNWKIFLSRLSKTFTEFCVFSPNSLARVLFKNGLYFFRVPKLSPQSIFEKSAVLKTYYPVWKTPGTYR